MKLGTLLSEGKPRREGELVVVSHDNRFAVRSELSFARTLRKALENWKESSVELSKLYAALNRGNVAEAFSLDHRKFLAPLPDAPGFYDGSAFLSHVVRARKSRGAEIPDSLREVPLMYQGVSDNNLPHYAPIELMDLAFGGDFEGEFAVITTDIPRGTPASRMDNYVALVVMFNDITFRELIKKELPTQFGFLQSKPNSSYAPFAVTTDELGSLWNRGRVELDLNITFNGKKFGSPNGKEMHFSFFELMAHATKTRPLSAGSIIGSGTVSNEDKMRGFACLTERRFQEVLDGGEAKTAWLKPGDCVEMDVLKEGVSIFGKIEQVAVL